MGVTRAQLGRGPAIVTWNGITMFTRDDIVARHAPNWAEVQTSMYGEVDKVPTDLVIKIPLRLWGAWENLTVLFPAAVMTPVVGASIFGATDLPLVIHGRNGDTITYHNAHLTRLADLFLGVDSELFASDVEFTALIKDGGDPEDTDAYYTAGTAAYSDAAFAKTNFKRARWSAAWGTKTGFTAFAAQKGFNISWDMRTKPLPTDGLGTVDMALEGLVGTCRCIPIQPTIAQIEAVMQGRAHGALLSAGAADLVLTESGGGTVTLKAAGALEHGYAFGVEPLRIGEMAWATTRGFTAGAPAAVGAVATT